MGVRSYEKDSGRARYDVPRPIDNLLESNEIYCLYVMNII